MNKSGERATSDSEPTIKGRLVEEGIRITDKQFLDDLSSRGYGTSENNELLLTFYEGLYLKDRGILEVEDENGETADFQRLLQCYKLLDENAWARYLIYRDLRSRGYVVREGFGLGIDFRVYSRGDYNRSTAKYLIVSVQEGRPISIEKLTNTMTQSLSLKKELILSVMNRRGEVVYYSISELMLNQ